MTRARGVALALALAAGGTGAAVLIGGGPQPPAPPERVPARAVVSGTAYYVSPEGSDRADGTAPDRAWATLARAGRARLRPGDGILLRGGATFDDGPLVVSSSGTARAPVVIGSHGRGRARLTRSVFLRAASFVVVQDLEIEAAEQAVASLASSPAGARGVVVQRNRIRDTAIAVNSSHADDAGWVVRGNDIARTRDSAVIMAGARAEVSGNAIADAGVDESIGYGRHAVYLKGPHGTVARNRIRGFAGGSAVSVRGHDSRVEGNDLAGGAVGISWFQEDAGAGTSRWRDNRISATTRACIYVSPADAAGPTRESFVIEGNVLSPSAGRRLDLGPTTGRYTVRDNDRA